jgi:YVTN family beta-propeller protein
MGSVGGALAEEYLSPLALVADKDGRDLHVAEFTANQVAVFNLAEGKVTKAISLPDAPSGLALAPDEAHLYVTCGSPSGSVQIVDLKQASVTGSISVGHTPAAPVVSPDGSKLYVCNRFDNNVSVINLATRKETTRIPVLREPVAAAITPNGDLLFVANLLPAGAADAGYTAAVVSAIDTAANKVVANIQLPNGSMALRGVCVSPDGRHTYVTHILARYQLPTTQLERGWMNTNALSVIEVASQTLINTVLLDDIDLGGANPWGVVCTPDGEYICVAHAGTHELSVIDRHALHEKLTDAAKGRKSSESLNAMSYPDDVPNDLAFLVGLRRRIKLAGNGPRSLAIVGTKAYLGEYFTDSIGVVDIYPGTWSEARSIALGPEKSMTVVREGEMLFHDATVCFQHWQSCATCHPSDGRPDALNWDLLNDGMGNPKNTKNLLLAHKTPPAMITGVRGGAEAAVRAGIKFIQFVVRPEADAAAIDEYLKSLEPVPSPYLVDGKLSEAAERGKTVFEKAGCGSCHPALLYTDLKTYNVGTGKDREKDRKFDTPTLIELWRTGPYLYDGRAVTLKEVLTNYNVDDRHGTTSALTEQEISDLAEFILSQ